VSEGPRLARQSRERKLDVALKRWLSTSDIDGLASEALFMSPLAAKADRHHPLSI